MIKGLCICGRELPSNGRYCECIVGGKSMEGRDSLQAEIDSLRAKVEDLTEVKKELLRRAEKAEAKCLQYEVTIGDLKYDNEEKTERIDKLRRSIEGEENLKKAIKVLAELI